MPEFIAMDSSSNSSMTGSYNINTGRLFIPTAITLPVPQDAGQTVWVQPSGKLCIYNGTTWIKFGVNPIFEASGFNPSNPLVSGGLLWWGEPSGVSLNVATASGISSWTGRAPSIIGGGLSAAGTNVPTIMSGFLNGYRSVYFGGAGYFSHGGMNLGSADNDFTVFAVVTPQATSGGNASTLFHAGRSTTATPAHFFALRDTNPSGTQIFRRDDANALVNAHPPNTRKPLGETHIYTMAFSGTAVSMFIDGLQIWTSGMDVGTVTINTGGIGAVFSNSIAQAFYVGNITEMIVMDSGCGLEAQKGIHSYLSSKYSIPLMVGYA